MESKKADVICQHKTDGTIIPIKIRLQDEDGEYQVYSIRSYKDLTHPGEYRLPSGMAVAGNSFAYECKIAVFGREQIIYLIYNTCDNVWNVRHG